MRIALLDDYQKVALSCAPWRERLPDAEIVAFSQHVGDANALARHLRGFDVVVAMRERTVFDRTLLGQLRSLRLLVTTGRRNASIDLAAAGDLGITVCCTASGGYGTAELTWGLILALARKICIEDSSMRDGGWQSTVGVELAGRTLGVVGLGRLGSKVADIGAAFGMRVAAWSPHLTPGRAASANAALVSKAELFGRSDVITVHMVLAESTRGLVGAAEIARMRRTAFLVNTSRAGLVDYDALTTALRAGQIAGAGLDVFEAEPLPSDHPLRRLPNTVLTPHLGYVTDEAYRIYYSEALEDIEAFVAGSPLRTLTDQQRSS